MEMNREVVVTCAVTGAGDTVDKHPAIPVTAQVTTTSRFISIIGSLVVVGIR
jgi:uncharacterized protein (DUF849 family)